MNSKKLTVLIGSLTVLIAVVATLSVADDPRASVSAAVSEPAMSLEVESPDTLQASQLAESEDLQPWRCCCPWGCSGTPPCDPLCAGPTPDCLICPHLSDEDEEQIQVTWLDPGEVADTLATEQVAGDSAMLGLWCCPDGTCRTHPNDFACVPTSTCLVCALQTLLGEEEAEFSPATEAVASALPNPFDALNDDQVAENDSAMCCPWCCPDGSCDYSPNDPACVQTISCTMCPW